MKSKRILLVAPGYANKFPPLGLMKLSTYHKLQDDYVQFVKGCHADIRDESWDRIYISTVFTFYWNETIRTIKYYMNSRNPSQEVIVGGVMASLMGKEIEKETGARIIRGLINKPYDIGLKGRCVIDHLIPDYQILKDIDYEYSMQEAYIGYATRGCPNRCAFCAVNRIEPEFIDYVPLKRQVRGIEEIYGPKKDLLLLDNNVLASRQFKKIIKDILDLGFEKGANFNNRLRCLDFNQGIDARLLNKSKMKLLAKTAIRPLRIAFDSISMKDTYISAVRLASENGVANLSNYVLYNYLDTPQDFYKRLKINIQLNEQLGKKIYSFPMKYIPLNAKNRSYVGKHWNRQLIRGVQCILLATHGMVSPNKEFFKAAFGRSQEEFIKIALMPEPYIIHRRHYENNGALEWGKLYKRLTKSQRMEFLDKVSEKRIEKKDVVKASTKTLKNLYCHYVEA